MEILGFVLDAYLKVRVYTYWQSGRCRGRRYASRKQGNALAN